MTRKALCWTLLLALIPVAGAPVHGGEAELTAFESALGDRITVNLQFDQEQLLALADANQANPELRAAIASLESVRAQVCELDPEQVAAVREVLEDTAGQLRAAGWNTMVDVRSKGERIAVLLRLDQDHILGFVALFVSADGGGFAHAAGDLEMAQVMVLAKNVQAVRNFLAQLKPDTTG